MHSNVDGMLFVLTHFLCSSKESQFLVMNSMKKKTYMNLWYHLKCPPNTYGSYLVFSTVWVQLSNSLKTGFSLFEILAILQGWREMNITSCSGPLGFLIAPGPYYKSPLVPVAMHNCKAQVSLPCLSTLSLRAPLVGQCWHIFLIVMLDFTEFIKGHISMVAKSELYLQLVLFLVYDLMTNPEEI